MDTCGNETPGVITGKKGTGGKKDPPKEMGKSSTTNECQKGLTKHARTCTPSHGLDGDENKGRKN
jgi:hypothetical protein